MKLMALMIVALSLISTTWAQGQHTQTGRKSEPMQTHATRPEHCYSRRLDRPEPND